MSENMVEKAIERAQKNEITEYYIYKRLSSSLKDPHNKAILKQIAEDELKHYNYWKTHTNRDEPPKKILIWVYYLISKFFGITFGVRLMELGEKRAKINYSAIIKKYPEAESIIIDEELHENKLLELLDEDFLQYMGSIVLGLNDALVELTGALAGFTFAFNNTNIITIAGLITGIAAALSMASSEYLSTKSEHQPTKNPFKAATYTFLAYIFTVFFLIFPYFVFNYSSPFFCLLIALFNAIIIIFLFTFYISIAKSFPFKERFLEVITISLGITILTFIIGLVIKSVFNIEI